jgi:hypothetical protein
MLGHAAAAMTLDIYPTCLTTIWKLLRPHDTRSRETVGKMWARGGEPTNRGVADPAN